MNNPTAPANSTPDFLAGWNARAAADGTLPPPAQPVSAPVKPPTAAVPPSTVSTRLVPLTAALIAFFATARPGETLQLSAGTYTIPGEAVLSPDGVRLIGDPAGTTIVRKSVAGSTTGILLVGSGIEVAGITFDSDKPLATAGNAKVSVNALRVQGTNAYIHHCKSVNVDTLVFLTSTASGAKVENNTTGPELRADAIYIEQTSNALISGNTINGSKNEHGIRLDTLDGKTAPENITIDDNTIDNADGKESIAIRYGKNIAVTNNRLNAWSRVNQGPAVPAAPNTDCADVTYSGNTFGPGAYITINPYTPGVVVKSNTFHLDETTNAINVQGPDAAVEITGNTKTPAKPGTAVKPLIHTYGAVTLTGADIADAVKS